MTPEQLEKLEQLERDIQEIKQYIDMHKIQQISFPMDTSSARVIAQKLQELGFVIT